MVNPRPMADSAGATNKRPSNEPTGKTIVDGQVQTTPHQYTNADLYSSSTDVRELSHFSHPGPSDSYVTDARKTVGKRFVAIGAVGFFVVGASGFLLLNLGFGGAKSGDQAPDTIVSSIER